MPIHPLGLAMIGVVVSGQGQAALQTDAVNQLGTVVVTGTRADNRTEAESMQPLQVISAKTLLDSGSAELGETLSRLIPSLNFPRPSSSGFTGITRPAQMRGLSPDQVLVLVNGKRRHAGALLHTNVNQGRGSAPVDLNTIPISAIDHVEVLGDGASARYGSDAIAGVINIILKHDRQGGQISGSLGQTGKGDGLRRHLDADMGVALGERGSMHLSVDGNVNDDTNRAGPDLRTPGAPGYGEVTYRLGDPDVNNGKLLLNADYAWSDTFSTYGFAAYNRAKGDTWAAFQNGVDSDPLDTLAIPDGYRPTLHSESEDHSIVLGLKGVIAGWHWDGSVNYGRNTMDFYTRTSLNRRLFRDTGSRQRDFYDGTLMSSQLAWQLDFNRELNPGWLHNPLSVAFGLEYQHQRYRETSGEPASYYGTGVEGWSGFRDSDSGHYRRDLVAQYLDLETNVTDKWRASLAVRHDRYSDFGGATTGSLSSRYDFTPQVAVRASVSTGYRAPGLAQQHYSATTRALNTAINADQDQRTAPVDDPVARLFGSEDLTAETSRNISAGMVVRVFDALTATLDVYQIHVDDRISLSSNLNVQTPAAQDYLAANGIPRDLYQSVRYFTNAVNTRTRGLDLTGQYYWRFGNGSRLNQTISYAYNRTQVMTVKENPAVLEQNGLNLQRIDRRDRLGVLTDSTPRSKLSFANDYTLSRWSLHGNLVRYGSFLAISNAGPAFDQRYRAKWVLDVSTSIRVADWLLTAGADNINDMYPDRRNQINNPNDRNVRYISYSPFGMNGAFYYLKATYRW